MVLTETQAKVLIIDSLLNREDISLSLYEIFNNDLFRLCEFMGSEIDAQDFICQYYGLKRPDW